MNELLLAGGIFAVVVIGLIVFAIVVKMKEVQAAKNWIATTGKVTRSEVRALKNREMENRARIRNQPFVSFEFTVQGKRYTGDRISLGEYISEGDIEATLARYPVGAQVTVYYDPHNPQRSVLERALPAVGKELAGVLAFFGVGAVLVLLAIARGPALIAPYIPNSENAFFVVLSASGGFFLLLFGFAQQRQALAAQTWTSITGTITTSEVRAFTFWRDGFQYTHFAPVIVYRYNVRGNEYSNDRYSLGAEVSWSKRSTVEKMLERYPVDALVAVYYNPKAPAESVLDRRVTAGWLIWVLGFGLLVLAIVCTGIL